MHEITCPSCNKASQFNFKDYLLLCPYCSATFKFDTNNGNKEMFIDHYIIPNRIDSQSAKNLTLEWLKRMHHTADNIERDFVIVDVQGFSLPVWITSTECHTAWKGLIKKNNQNKIGAQRQSDYIEESGEFRRRYRWAVSSRSNICEIWGLAKLHETTEDIEITWDGFPFDSTMSRGSLSDEDVKNAYDARNYFEFKYSNGLPIMGIQIDEHEALRRARHHLDLYHTQLSQLNVDYLVDYRTEFEIAGVQLIHVPIWKVKYVYKPSGLLRFLHSPEEKNVLLNGYNKGLLKGELSIIYNEKLYYNAIITFVTSIMLMLVGLVTHPALCVVSIVLFVISIISYMKSNTIPGSYDSVGWLDFKEVDANDGIV